MGNLHELAICNGLEDEPAFAICHDIELTADGKLPEWIPLVPAGDKITALDGRKFSNSDPQSVVDAFKADPRDIPLDWEHSSQLKASKGERAPAAAWVDDMEVREGSIWGHVKEWNPDGAKDVGEKAYRYISPAFLFRKGTRIIARIVSAGLVNRPALDMPAIAHSRNPATEDTMDREKLIAKLGLAADATDEQIFAALDKLKAGPAAELKEVQSELASTNTKLEETKAELANARTASPSLEMYVPRSQHDATCAELSTLKAEVEAGKKKDRETAVASAIDAALKEGKIVPASKDQYTAMCSTEQGFEQFQALVPTLPVIVAPSDLDGKKPPAPSVTGEITPEEHEVAVACEMTDEEYLKQRAEALAEQQRH